MLISGCAEKSARLRFKEKTIMTSFKKILLSVKLSRQPDQIVYLIEVLGIGIHNEIHVIYVALIIQYATKFLFTSPYREKLETKTALRAKKSLKELLKDIFANRDFKSTVVLDDSSKQIIKYAQTTQIDLIAMNIRKKNRLKKILFGSVVAQVTKKSPIAVFCNHLQV